MQKIPVKSLRLGDVEDPDIYLGAISYDWMQTEHGAWCRKNSSEMVYQLSMLDDYTYGYSYIIYASFTDEDAFIYKLKWGDHVT